MVGVGGDVAADAVEGLAGYARKLVPDGGAAAVYVGCAFDLEGSYRSVSEITERRVVVGMPVANPQRKSAGSLLL